MNEELEKFRVWPDGTVQQVFRWYPPTGDNDAGQWVRYEDHAAVITALRIQQPAPAAQKLKGQICISDINQSAACAVGSVGTTSDAQTTRSTHDAPATQQVGWTNADADAARLALPEITVEDRLLLHYNPNTGDIVKWVRNYARAAITADRAARAPEDSVTAPVLDYPPLPTTYYLAGGGLHPKTANLVQRFAAALAEKLASAEKKYGYSDGWSSPDWMDECRQKLAEHVAKGDPRDVAAYCAFLWHHEASTAPIPPAQAAESVLEDAARYRWLRRWKGQEHEPPFTVQHEVDGTLWGGDLDAAVDAARKQGGA